MQCRSIVCVRNLLKDIYCLLKCRNTVIASTVSVQDEYFKSWNATIDLICVRYVCPLLILRIKYLYTVLLTVATNNGVLRMN